MPYTDKLLPNFEKLRRLSEEPRLSISKMLIVDPARMLPKMLTCEPYRMAFLSESELLSVTKSNVEISLPPRRLPSRLQPLPKRPKLRKLKDEPRCT
jgi:hypothetical protein